MFVIILKPKFVKMSINKTQKLKLQALQKEQVQLVRIESILTNLLGKVNESLNELKVS